MYIYEGRQLLGQSNSFLDLSQAHSKKSTKNFPLVVNAIALERSIIELILK